MAGFRLELVFGQFRRLEFRLALDPKRHLGRDVQRFLVAVGDEFLPDIPLMSFDFIRLLFVLLLLHIFVAHAVVGRARRLISLEQIMRRALWPESLRESRLAARL
jgi:hypothetical protein